MSILMIPLAAESSAGPWPWVVGGSILVVMVFLMLALLAFGKGREHS